MMLTIFGYKAVGPSPRVRGKLAHAALHDFNPGSIPTCAGETIVQHPFQPLIKVHPHVCGGDDDE